MRSSHLVLVVDDDPDVRALFVDTLRDAGHVVTEATDGQDALRHLREDETPCVILADVRMPKMDGWELARAIARDPRLSSVPVLLVTGDRVLAYTSPARDKPMSPVELDSLISQACRQHRASVDDAAKQA